MPRLSDWLREPGGPQAYAVACAVLDEISAPAIGHDVGAPAEWHDRH